MRYTIGVDFDGVLHGYVTPWEAAHIIPDPPVEGAIDWLRGMAVHFDIAIVSTRCKSWRGRRAMRRWIWRWDTGQEGSFAAWCDTDPLALALSFPKHKPPALIYLDDRAVRFEGPGTFPSAELIHRLRPWNKPPRS